MQSMSKNFSV